MKIMARLSLVILLLALLPVGSVFGQGGDEVELAASFVSEDGSITFSYPEGWLAGEFMPGLLLASNSEEAGNLVFGDTDDPIPSGSAALSIFAPAFLTGFYEDGIPESMADAWEALGLEEEEEAAEYSEPEEVTVAEHPAMKVTVTSEESDGVYYLIDFDGEYMVVITATLPGEYEDQGTVLSAIVETISYEYVIPEGPQPFSTEDEIISLEYPGGWVALELFGTIAVSNDRGLMGRDSEDPVLPGMVYIFIFRPELRTIEAADMTDAVTQYAELTIQGEEIELGEAAETTVGDYDAVRLDYTTERDEGYLLAVDYDGQTMYIQVSAASGELVDFEADALTVLESIEYTPAE